MRGLEPIRWTYIPLAALIFFYLPGREVVISAPYGLDPHTDTHRGFPLIWRRDSIFSLEFDVFAWPLLINVGACLLVAACIACGVRHLPLLNNRFVGAVLAMAVWTTGVPVLVLLVLWTLALGSFRYLWYDPSIWRHVTSDTWSWFWP